MKITANMVGYVISPLIAGALAFGGSQYTKGQDDLILETMITKLDSIDVPRITLALDKLDRINITILDQRTEKLGQLDFSVQTH